MAYTKTTWVNGDIITAEKLNNIKDGIADRSESDGGSKVIIVSIEDDVENEQWRLVGTTIAPNLTIEDLFGYNWVYHDDSSWVPPGVSAPVTQSDENIIVLQFSYPQGNSYTSSSLKYYKTTGEIKSDWGE